MKIDEGLEDDWRYDHGEGLTPLMAASYYNQFHVVKYLLEEGADCRISMKEGDKCRALGMEGRQWRGPDDPPQFPHWSPLSKTKIKRTYDLTTLCGRIKI
jgi:hypothetical protein